MYYTQYQHEIHYSILYAYMHLFYYYAVYHIYKAKGSILSILGTSPYMALNSLQVYALFETNLSRALPLNYSVCDVSTAKYLL
jgi:hypothetical protein